VTGWSWGEPTLADLAAEYPSWRCFQGINGLYYARHEATGEQVSGEDPLDLRDQIRAAQARSCRNDSTLSLLACGRPGFVQA
jgi:hypothetical protein